MDDLRKDRLAFVSGTILVWGLALVQLWNTAAHFQTGGNIRAWTVNTPGQGVLAPLWVFWFISALMTFGGWAVLLSVVHILCHGLSLMDIPGGTLSGSHSPSGSLSTLSYWTYASVFIQWFMVGFLLALTPLVLLSAGLEQLMAHVLPVRVAGWIGRSLVVIVVFIILRPALFKLLPMIARLAAVRGSVVVTAVVILFGFLFSWMAVIESCYTVTLSIDTKVVQRDKGATVTVTLGGATSGLSEARLQFASDQGTLLQTPVLHQGANTGDYFAYLPAMGLAPGAYRVTLRYPHTSFSSLFPYIRGETVRSETFLVVP